MVISTQFQLQCILKPKSTTKIFVLVRASVMFLSLYYTSDTASLQAICVALKTPKIYKETIKIPNTFLSTDDSISIVLAFFYIYIFMFDNCFQKKVYIYHIFFMLFMLSHMILIYCFLLVAGIPYSIAFIKNIPLSLCLYKFLFVLILIVLAMC